MVEPAFVPRRPPVGRYPICHAGIPGRPQELIGLYLAVTQQHIGNDLAALHRWNEAEEPLRYALTRFEAARMPAWSEPARLDLGIVLRHLTRHQEATRSSPAPTMPSAC
ncbi:tetratricopeptide repeat protein [Streptomyces nojiriensis]|uniref:tetratricopeptide repeat protein n=1 Tax=Streptomyces nojiriensis TaxID=66374 RepID=UPI0035E25CCE